MKYYFKLNISNSVFRILLLFGFSLISFSTFAQSGTITGTGTVDFADHMVSVNGRKIFTSHVSPNGNVDNMLQLDVISLFQMEADLSGDLACQVKNANAYAILSVYSYDTTNPDKKGVLLYRLEATYNPDGMGIVAPVDVPFGSGTVKSDQIKTLIQNAGTWLVDLSKCTSIDDLNLFKTTMAYINYQVNPLIQSPLNNCLKGNNYKLLQPIIVEVEAQDVTFVGDDNRPEIKFPGQVGDFYLGDYFNEDRAIEVQVKVNGVVKQTYNAGNENPIPLDITLGDSVTYQIKHYGKLSPTIEGMPGVWIARFAGDLMYYCSPSVTPGEFNPWIGYDSRVHTLQLRNMNGSPGFKNKVSDWDDNQKDIWVWGWYAQRQMDATKTKYEASYTWPKYKTLPNGSFQRNNQREGLNVQFLNYWQQGENSNFRNYSGTARYMMGFDDDELLYLNSQYHDAINHPPGTNGGIAKLDSIPSRGMPEGKDLIYDVSTGYPAQGFPLNMIISAYRKNREWVVNNKPHFKKYDGYEIQDIGTDDKNPDGKGTGNNTAPGVITIKAGGKRVTITMNVSSPLAENKGFYGSLEGNRWPAYNEKNISYTLSGLQGLTTSELDKFSMEYEGSDALGNLMAQTKYLKDLSSNDKQQVSSTGTWTASFNNTYPTYSCITSYYQRTSESEKVIVAGKELKPIFLLFIGEKYLEGKGLGAKIWLNDFREYKTLKYSESRNFGNKVKYMKPDSRIYTFHVGDTTTFQAWDGDPHLFYEEGIEWFLSSRTLAKRIPDNYLDGSATSVPYLKYYINNVEQTTGRKGKEFKYKWNTPGTYTLKVEYRTAGGLTTYQHKINVVDYPAGSRGKRLGNVTSRSLTIKEAFYLRITHPSEYKVFEVVDVYSNYEYKTGPRANNPYPNRWAEHSDYASEYHWQSIDIPSFVDDFINNYSDLKWFWYDWALHYSSNWRDNKPYGLPDYVGNSQVTRVITTELDKFSTRLKSLFDPLTYAKWQYTVPLVSYTDYQGNRMRTNPSCLYDLYAVWSNTSGAFSGNPILPNDPSLIQAPDITDDQKDMQELYYDLKSKKKAIIKITGSVPLQVKVFNARDKTAFICEFDPLNP